MEEWRIIYFAKALDCSFPILQALHCNTQAYADYWVKSWDTESCTNLKLFSKTVAIIGKRATGKSSLVRALASLSPSNDILFLTQYNVEGEVNEILEKPKFNRTIILEDFDASNFHQTLAVRNLFFHVVRSESCRLILTTQYSRVISKFQFDCYFIGRLPAGECVRMQQFLNFPIKTPTTKLNYWMKTMSHLKFGQWFFGQIHPDRKYGIVTQFFI